MKTIYYFLLIPLVLFATSIKGQGSGNALELNGTSNYANCGTINLGGNALTMQAWVKVDAFKTTFPFISSIMGTEAGTSQAMLRLGDAGLAAEKVQFIIQISGTPRKLDGNISLTAGKWHHIAATYDGATMKIFVNGLLDASRAQTGNITSNSTFSIGRNYGNDRILDGQLDEMSVFKAALSEATIRDYMCKGIDGNHPNVTAIEGYWKMDGAGNNLTDFSNNNHTGTYVSTPLKVTSSAPIGNASVTDYTTPTTISIAHPDGDSVVISNITGTPNAVHLYRVDQKPNTTTLTGSSSAIDTTRYWGVYFVGGTNPSGNLLYNHVNNTFYASNNSCFVDLASRTNNSITSWTPSSATQTATNMSLTGVTRSEFILAFSSNKEIHPDTVGGICIGDSVELKTATSGFAYQWFKDGQALTNDTMNSLMIRQAGTYFLTMSFNGCADTTNSFRLTVGQKPVVSMASISPICITNSLTQLSGGMPLGGTYDNPFVSGYFFMSSNAGAGNHKIVYRYADQNGCADTASTILKVHALPSVSITPFNSICEDTAVFSLSSGTPSGGVYSINGTSATSFDPSVYGVGTHSVSYVVTDANNCTDSSSESITVNALPSVRLIFPNNSVCEGAAPFNLNGNGNSPLGGGFSGTGVVGFNFEPITSGVGAFPITYNFIDPTTGCKNSAIDTFNVKAAPATPSVTQNGSELEASTGDSYQWYDKDGAVFGETKQIYKPLRTGKYRVSIVVAGCESAISEEFDFDKSLVGISVVNENARYSIYPNPANHEINIEGENVNSISIIDLSGKTILVTELNNSGFNTIELNQISAGTYIVEVTFTEGNSARQMLVIE